VYVGLRLASPKEFLHAWETGKEQFAFFAITCFFTIVEDLLVGIAAGLLAAVIFQVFKGAALRTLVAPKLQVSRSGEELLISVTGSASFSNFHLVRSVIERASGQWKTVAIDLSKARVVDHGFLEKLDRLTRELPAVTVRRSGLEHHRALSKHPKATRVLPRAFRNSQSQTKTQPSQDQV
jgi:MFS superfamily sulfate permease-like transporter